MSKDRTPTPTTPTERRAHTLTVTFSVGARADERLQSDTAIRSEIGSWLESLDATVHVVDLAKPVMEPRRGG